MLSSSPPFEPSPHHQPSGVADKAVTLQQVWAENEGDTCVLRTPHPPESKVKQPNKKRCFFLQMEWMIQRGGKKRGTTMQSTTWEGAVILHAGR